MSDGFVDKEDIGSLVREGHLSKVVQAGCEMSPSCSSTPLSL